MRRWSQRPQLQSQAHDIPESHNDHGSRWRHDQQLRKCRKWSFSASVLPHMARLTSTGKAGLLLGTLLQAGSYCRKFDLRDPGRSQPVQVAPAD